MAQILEMGIKEDSDSTRALANVAGGHTTTLL